LTEIQKDAASDAASIRRRILIIFNTFKDLKKLRFWGSGMWSDGTFYSSVGGVSEEAVKRYIETQKERG